MPVCGVDHSKPFTGVSARPHATTTLVNLSTMDGFVGLDRRKLIKPPHIDVSQATVRVRKVWYGTVLRVSTVRLARLLPISARTTRITPTDGLGFQVKHQTVRRGLIIGRVVRRYPLTDIVEPVTLTLVTR